MIKDTIFTFNILNSDTIEGRYVYIRMPPPLRRTGIEVIGLDTVPNGILNLGSVSVFDAVDFQVVP